MTWLRERRWRRSSCAPTSPSAQLSFLLVGLIASVVAVASPVAAHQDDVYEFSGSGWGHSIGMSQYGAYGQALEEATYDEILSYYYEGVSISTIADLVDGEKIPTEHSLVVDDSPVWVGIRQSISSIMVTPVGGPLNLCQAVDEVETCVDLGWSVDEAAETWEINETEAGCLVERIDPPPQEGENPPLGLGSCTIDLTWAGAGQAERLTLDGDLCGEADLGLGRECFSRGTLHLRGDQVTSGFHVVVELGLKDYLYGLGEMPSSWPIEALKAQVLAGRSYAARRVLTHEKPELAVGGDAGLSDGRRASCWCHLYSTSVDQNYTGYAKEAETSGGTVWGDRWVEAVDLTSGEVITHPDETPWTIILSFYHSSSGGHTESNEAIWGTSALAYLQPVADPWSNADAVGNPFSAWTESVTAEELADELGWDAVSHVTLMHGAPGAQFEIRGTIDGESVTETRSAGWMYYAIGSRSPHFDGVAVDRYVPFLDMSGTGHDDAIYAVWEAGITAGCGDDYYCPDDDVTRAQMASFISRALELEPVRDGPFSDIAHTGPYRTAINAVAARGISLGCGDGRFCPDDLVSRAQLASFLARALGLDPVGEGPFSDLAGVGTHRTAINAIALAGISRGCANELYCPHDLVSQAQMASFLARAFIWGDESEPGAAPHK